MHITGTADVQAVIADPRFVPPPPAAPGPVGTMTWLRATVARFSSGAVHARRRAIVEAELAAVDLGSGDPGGVDLTELPATEPKYQPVAALAVALGITDAAAAVAAVRSVAAAYQGRYGTPPDDTPPDDAVAALVAMLPAADPEVTANRIGIMVQACDATAALIESALIDTAGDGSLEEALRDHPPVRVTRRQALVDARIGEHTIPAGTVVTLDISALPFGGDARPCPGRKHALALAARVVEARTG